MTQPPFKILVVDDLEIVRAMVKASLGQLGFAGAEEAENGQQAIDKIIAAQNAGQPYDFIFCEWTLPVVSGIGVLNFCRTSEDFKETPFIMITGELESAAVVKAIRAGATDYLVKPIALDILDRKLTKIVSRITGSAA
jgi:two-component system, chemotaxis family, chemotaxis protein CheY